jgi:hypothetical protein
MSGSVGRRDGTSWEEKQEAMFERSPCRAAATWAPAIEFETDLGDKES